MISNVNMRKLIRKSLKISVFRDLPQKNLILCLFIFLILVSCQTVYYFGAEPINKSENELEVWFFLDTIKPNIQINFLFNSNTQITDFELKDWFFQIGDNIIDFDLNNMHFSGTEIETGFFLTLFENSQYDIESINRWNQEYKNEYEIKSNNFQYKFWMTRFVDRQLAEEIREKNISFLKVHLEFSFMINDEKYYHIIDEDFTIKVKKGYFTIFDMLNPANY
jgi:hypothetical protein